MASFYPGNPSTDYLVVMNLVGINKDLLDAVKGPPFKSVYSSVPSSPEFPTIYCGFPESLTDFSSTGSCTLNHSLVVMVSRSDEDSAQEALSKLLSIDLIVKIIRFESVNWSQIEFRSINSFRAAKFGNADALGADLNLLIRTT